MEIFNTPVDAIKPDPNQPRQTIDEDLVAGIAVNMRHQGVINAIEVDQDNVIITGELRWRAAKKAGLDKVPTKVILNIKAYDRYMRQVSENVHHNTMTAWDTAVAIGKLRDGNGRRRATRVLGEELGKSTHWVEDHLNLLGAKPEMKKYLQKPDAKTSYVLEMRHRIPPRHRKAIEKKILDSTIGTRRGIRGLGAALHHHPKKADELLKLNFQGKGDADITRMIDAIAPTPVKQIEDIVDRGAKVRSVTKHLLGIIKGTTLNDYAPLEVPEIKLLLRELGMTIPTFLESLRKELSESRKE